MTMTRKKQYRPEFKGFIIVPNTLENRPYGWDHDDPTINCTILNGRERSLLLVRTMIFEDINEATDLLIGACEEEEIPYEKLDAAIKIVEKKLKKFKMPELIVATRKLLDALYLAKEKKTLVALYL